MTFSGSLAGWLGTALVLLSGGWNPAFSAESPSPTPQQIEFFERKVRPVLVEQCYSCHSQTAEKGVKGGLLLDTRDGWVKGGDTGPAIVPGDPDKSLLIKTVRYIDADLRMPPKNKRLSPEQIADLESWVKMGAPDPRTDSTPALSPFEIILQQGKSHWAFQPVKPQATPTVKNQRWVQSPVDNFVLAKLESKGMKPAPAADRRTLIRRATYDLIGLPPTPDEVAAFLADKSPQAFERVVERLLASPHYGERWARHWLDVARYADTKGYLAGDEQRRYAYSYTYRDYVIRAFNEDVPYDRFIREQLAADRLELGEDKRALAALGFLTLGRRFLNNPHDIIDDRIDVVSRGLMGLTVACARCHDHKYDPVSTKEYYSLYGVFSSSVEPEEKPLLGIEPPRELHEQYLAEKRKREEELENFRQRETAKEMAELRQRAGEYLLAAFDVERLPDQAKAQPTAQQRKLELFVVQRWIEALKKWSAESHPVFTPWFAFAQLPEAEFAEKAKALAEQFAKEKAMNPLLAPAFAGQAPASMKEVAEIYGKVFAEIEKQWQAELKAAGEKKAEPPAALPDPNGEALRQILYADSAPTSVPPNEQDKLLEGARPKLRQLKAKVDEVDATHAGAPPRGMVLNDRPQAQDVKVFIRGNSSNRGEVAPRQFLSIVSKEAPKPFRNGSGRLELAEAIASRDNPLTARVLVNRVWMHHFGEGLVRTPSDFGTRSDPPTHPELLDYLAWRFMEEGWSIKTLHRWIMLSSTYQQSSDPDARVAVEYAKRDPDNFWLWKMNRRRLEFEPLRDTLLQVAGRLDLTPGGQAVDIIAAPFNTRRTVYGFIDRQNLPGVFRDFDFASPDSSTAQRYRTTVPQQALFLMNSPFVIEQARQWLERPEFAALSSDEQRIHWMYHVALQRPPAVEELKTAREFIAAQTALDVPPPPVWQYGYGEYDSANQRVSRFEPFPHFTKTAWQGGEKLPDTKLGYALLNADGGHTGRNPDHAAIRRWTVPRDGVIKINGKLHHPSDKGDGVRGRIVSSRSGLAGEWSVHNSTANADVEKLEVRQGDTIDFVADCRSETSYDSFNWAPAIKYADGAANGHEWNAKKDFGPLKEGPKRLQAWEKLAQVLLLSNELAFVD